MWPLFGQRLDYQARGLLPLLITVLLTIFNVIIWPLPFLGQVVPLLPLIAIFYWAVYRPDLFTPLAAFGIGIIHDALNGLPLGVSALIFPAAHYLAYSQRRFFIGHPFFMLWFGFGLVAMLGGLIQWLLVISLAWRWFDPLPVFLQAVLTIGVFPLVAWILISLQRVVWRQV